MSTRDVKYWKRITEHSIEPHSISLRDRARTMSYRGNEAWCKACKAVVEYDSKLDATGIVDICPFCGSETSKD